MSANQDQPSPGLIFACWERTQWEECDELGDKEHEPTGNQALLILLSAQQLVTEKEKKKNSNRHAMMLHPSPGHSLHPLLKPLPLGAGVDEDQGKAAATSWTPPLGRVPL